MLLTAWENQSNTPDRPAEGESNQSNQIRLSSPFSLSKGATSHFRDSLLTSDEDSNCEGCNSRTRRGQFHSQIAVGFRSPSVQKFFFSINYFTITLGQQENIVFQSNTTNTYKYNL